MKKPRNPPATQALELTQGERDYLMKIVMEAFDKDPSAMANRLWGKVGALMPPAWRALWLTQ